MLRVNLLTAQLLCLLLLFANSAFGDWQGVGSLVASEPQGNQITFRSRQATAIITVLAPDLVRVRMVPGPSPGPDYSWAVAKTDWPMVSAEFTGSKDSRVIRTSELEVRVQLSPFRLTFYDRSGRLISKDADSRGMSWEGPRVRCWKWMPADEHYFGLGEKSNPLDKRGHSYVMWNTDPAGFDASTDPLYQSVPFLLALREGRAYGLFFDNTYRSSFDLGAESPDLYSFGAEGIQVRRFRPQVEGRAVGIIEKEAVSPPFAQSEQERDRLVERVGRGIKSSRVGIPHDVRVAALVQGIAFFAQAKIVFVRRHPLPAADAWAFPTHSSAVRILRDQPATPVVERQTEWGKLDTHLQFGSTDDPRILASRKFRRDHRPVGLGDGPRIVRAGRRSRNHPHPDQIGSQHGNDRGGLAAAERYLVTLGLGGDQAAHTLPIPESGIRK